VRTYYGVEGSEAVLAAADATGGYVRSVVYLALVCLLRRGEIGTLRGTSVRKVSGEWVLRVSRGKTSLMQEMRVPQVVGEMVSAAGTGKVVPVSWGTVYRALDEMAAAYDVPLVRPHDLRATGITLALDSGVDARDVMATAGHARLSTTARYDLMLGSIERSAAGQIATALKL